MSQDFAYRCRGEFVLCRRLKKDTSRGGVAIPGTSASGVSYVVVHCGPKVEGLKQGEEVILLGKMCVDIYPLVDDNDLVVVPQGLVVLVKDPIPDDPKADWDAGDHFEANRHGI